jgi:L-lactate dehydrogenase complex protein LldE
MSTVSLLVPCLVDQWYPRVAEATERVLREAGSEVECRLQQTCCGQPAYNAGYHEEARAVARRSLDVFEGATCVVTPSGSCAAMVKRFYPRLFAGDRDEPRALALAERTFELTEYLVRVRGLRRWAGHLRARLTYHDSCHLRRELGVVDEPRALLASIEGVELVPLPGAHQCCGFGGLFSVRYPELSGAILDDKLSNVLATPADALVLADAGCQAQIGGGLSHRGRGPRVLHVAEVLAAALDGKLPDEPAHAEPGR